MRLLDRICLVTNAGDLMGPAFSAELQNEGARLALQTRDLAVARERLEHEGVSTGADHVIGFIEADFAIPGVADQEIDRLVGEVGRLDVLLNNNVGPNAGPLEDLADEMWKEMVLRLVEEPMRTTRAALRHMLRRGQGRIVTLTSAGGVTPWPDVPIYSALRAFMVNLTRGLGKALAPRGVYVKAIAQNAVVNPTYFPENERNSPEIQEEILNLPIRRLAEGWESARLAGYLASEDSDFLCAEVIKFAGGWG